MKKTSPGWSYREQQINGQIEERNFSVNIWSLQFVEKSLKEKFKRGLFHQRKTIMRFCLVLYSPLLVYELIFHLHYTMSWMIFVYTALLCVTCIVLIFTFTKLFRKWICEVCTLTCVLLLLIHFLNSIGLDDEVRQSSSMFLDVLMILLGIGLQLNFMVTALLLVLNIDVITILAFQSSEMERTQCMDNYVTLAVASLVVLVVTYMIMLGRINMFVLLSKGQMAEKQVMKDVKQMQTNWIAQVAHDLGTPLATFSLGNQMLRDTDLTEEQADILATQECAVELMTITRNKGMDFAKLESGNALKPHCRPLDVRHLVETKCRRIMIGYGSENPMYFEVDTRIAQQVITDRDWVWEMLINYLNNAQKFTHTGRIVVRVTLVRNREFMRFEVSDTGIGISDEQKERLFKPYSQLQRGAGGTGLGLNSVMQKARALGGSVGVRDNIQDGMGSVFWFDIPYQPDVVCDSDPNSPSQSITEKSMYRSPTDSSKRHFECELSKGTVLVADDQRCILKFLTKSLEKQGFQVETANNGADALKKMKQKIFQAVILDDQMPGLTGQEVCRRIRLIEMNQSESHPRQYIIIVSGAVSDIPPSTGYDQAIGKPVDIKKLLKLLYQSVCSPLASGYGAAKPMSSDKSFEDQGISPKSSSSLKRRFFTNAQQLSAPPRESRSRSRKVFIRNDSNTQNTLPVFSPVGSVTASPASWAANRNGKLASLNSSTDTSPASCSFRFPPSPTVSDSERECRIHSEVPLLSPIGEQTPKAQRCKKVQKSLQNMARKSSRKFMHSDLNPETTEGNTEEKYGPQIPSESTPDKDKPANFVLLIEDEMSILKFTSRMFQKNNFQVHTAMNGLEGLEMMKKNRYIAVFTDINMPVMDGFECVRRFRDWELECKARNSRQFICAVTANVCEHDRESAMATGLMDAFITKPAKIKELIAIVKSPKCQSMLTSVTQI